MTNYPEMRPLGLDALVVRFSGELEDRANRAALAFSAAVRAAKIVGVEEVASALSSLLIRFDPLSLQLDDLTPRIGGLLGSRDWYSSDLPDGIRRWSVPVALGGNAGPEFDEAARIAGKTPGDLRDMIESVDVRVLSIGFAPGQPYMGLLPSDWDIPRKSALTAEVPPGALVMAVRQLIIFAQAAPTGWRQIGRTGFRPFRANAANPITLAPGDQMQFRVVEENHLEGEGDGLGSAVCEVAK